MADDLERCEAEIDLDVTFNEFDEDFGNFSEESHQAIAKKLISGDNRQDSKHFPCRHANVDGVGESGVTDEAGNSTKVEEDGEEGEVSSSNEDEAFEKMDCDEGNGKEIKSFSQRSEEDVKKLEKFTFLSPNSVFKESDKKGNLDEDLKTWRSLKRDCEEDSVMLSLDSDNSMDDQSWKRHKRARLEEVSREADDRTDDQKKKRRGGRRKRKRPVQSRCEDVSRRRNSPHKNTERQSGNKLFKPLTVTSDDSERVVAREIADKLSEAKTMLIQRVVTCIGCEKAIKLFRDTQEVERHGGMQTKDGDRRRTSGGVFLMLLKHRYVTKEQSKWIFALENEMLKKKAKEEQQRMKELQAKNVADLRLKLIERDKE